jgi:hypothetical protein
MPTRTPLHPNRRHFLQAAAAFSTTAAWIGRANAGPAAGAYGSSHYAIDLGGESVQWLRSLTLPSYALEDDRYERGLFKASYPVSQGSAVLDWILSLARRESDVRAGAVVVTDFDDDVKRRVEWTGGRVVQVALPVLSTKDAKRSFAIDFAWDAASVSHGSGGGAKGTLAQGKTPWTTSNYRVSGLPGENEYVTSVALPTITAKTGGGEKKKPAPTLGELTLEFAARSRDVVLGYVEQVIADGRLGDGELLDLAIQMLDPGLSKTLGTVRLYGCGLKRYEEAPYGPGADAGETIALKFAVTRVDLEV